MKVIQETLQKAEQLSGAMSNSVQDFVVISANDWMAKHPIISWIIAYPLWSLALILLMLLLCWSLFGAIAKLTQQFWLFILQAPLRLIQLLSKGIFQLFKGANTPQSVALNPQQDEQKRLFEILNRLEILQHEQEVLMGEVRSILCAKH